MDIVFQEYADEGYGSIIVGISLDGLGTETTGKLPILWYFAQLDGKIKHLGY